MLKHILSTDYFDMEKGATESWVPVSSTVCGCIRFMLPRICSLPAPWTAASPQGRGARAWKATQGDPKQEDFILQTPVLYLASLSVKWGEDGFWSQNYLGLH